MTDTTNNSRIYYSPIIGGVTTGLVGGEQLFNKKLPLKKALARGGVYGLMAMGLSYPIEYRYRRSRNANIVKEASCMHNKFFNKTDLDEFVKIAANRIGNIAYQVPTPLAYDAMTLYESLPKKTAATIVSNLYDNIEAGMNKVAMEMVAANILEREKIATPVNAIRTAYKGLKTMGGKYGGKAMTAGEVGLTGYSVKETADHYQSKDRNPYQVGKSYRN